MNFDSESDVAGPRSYWPFQDVAEFLTVSNQSVAKVEEKSSANWKDLCRRRRRHRLRRFCRSMGTTSFMSTRSRLKK